MNPSPKTPWVLGLSYSHNASACLLHGGELVAAIQEERLTRNKRQRMSPKHAAMAVSYCLEVAGIGPEDLDLVAISAAAMSSSASAALLDRLRANPQLAGVRDTVQFLTYPHHMTHAAYAGAVTGVESAAVLVADGMGSGYDALDDAEKDVVATTLAPIRGRQVGLSETLSIYGFDRGRITPLFKQMTARMDGRFGDASESLIRGTTSRHGLGAMYERSSRVIFGEAQQSGKVMGLAPYGEPTIPVEDFHAVGDDNALDFRNPPALDLERARARGGGLDVEGREARNLAASVQRALEDGMLHFARGAHELTGSDTLVLSGGVALNGVANERIIRETPFRKVHIPPAVEDSGNSVGAAYLAFWEYCGPRPATALRVDATGRDYSGAEIDAAVAACPLVGAETLGDAAIEKAVACLTEGQILGWFQGRSELGPRALGQRSILCDPRPADAKDRLNRRVKRREAFRPFAPIVLADHAAEWFDLPPDIDPDGPFMTRVVPIRPEKQALIPAVTHVDGTGRFQTVGPENGAIFDLVTCFHERTGVPVVLNTSFNLAGEPIVEAPADAVFDLLVADLDGVVLHDRLVRRRDGRRPGISDLAPEIIGQFVPKEEAGGARKAGVMVNATAEEPFGDVYYRVSGPWGDAFIHMTETTMPLLLMVDGQRTVGDIAALAQGKLAEFQLSERMIEGILATLVRKRLLGLRAPGADGLIRV